MNNVRNVQRVYAKLLLVGKRRRRGFDSLGGLHHRGESRHPPRRVAVSEGPRGKYWSRTMCRQIPPGMGSDAVDMRDMPPGIGLPCPRATYSTKSTEYWCLFKTLRTHAASTGSKAANTAASTGSKAATGHFGVHKTSRGCFPGLYGRSRLLSCTFSASHSCLLCT